MAIAMFAAVGAAGALDDRTASRANYIPPYAGVLLVAVTVLVMSAVDPSDR